MKDNQRSFQLKHNIPVTPTSCLTLQPVRSWPLCWPVRCTKLPAYKSVGSVGNEGNYRLCYTYMTQCGKQMRNGLAEHRFEVCFNCGFTIYYMVQIYNCFIVWYQFLFVSKSFSCKELKNRTCMFNVKLSTFSWESWWMWNLQCWLTFTAQGNHCDVKDPGKIKRHKSAEEHQNLLQKFVAIFKSTSKVNASPQVATEGPFICHYVSMTFHLDQVSFLLVSIFY